MNNRYYPLLMVLLIVALGIGGRLLLMRLVHTACPALRFRFKAALFVLYTLALILMGAAAVVIVALLFFTRKKK